MKILCVGDPHFRESLPYSGLFPDRRKGEVQAVLDATVQASENCDAVVLLGDCFDTLNPSADVIRAFTAFVERFEGKEVYILSGNHDKNAKGVATIDYLREVRNPKWHIITNTVEAIDGLVFCPYFFKQELGVNTNEEAQILLTEQLPSGKILFVHHAISKTFTNGGQSTSIFNEVVLPMELLQERFHWILGGHIHKNQRYGSHTVVAGSLFTQEAGDGIKSVWVLDTEKDEIKEIPLPVRPIIRLENPSLLDLMYLPRHCILKMVFTQKQLNSMDEYREFAKCHSDAFILQEQYPRERLKKLADDMDLMDATLSKLIRMYAVQKKLDPEILIKSWEKIK